VGTAFARDSDVIWWAWGEVMEAQYTSSL
jgi:hypothetical protein